MAEVAVSARRSSGGPLLSEDGPLAGRRNSHFSVKTVLPQRVGAQISLRYDIDSREIGGGGHGKVFKAMDKDRKMGGRMVAIKKVICRDEEKKKAFQNEIRIMLELDHPNICKLFETYDEGIVLFLVMEYLFGGELYDRIMDEGNLEEPIVADIIRQVASALLHAHARGVAHRDMKPENICFCTDDYEDTRVKVIDWGLGFYFGLSKMKTAVGTEAYAAPEVLESSEDQNYTSACDLWSLGVLAYVMLSGRQPFLGGPLQQVQRMRNEEYDMSKNVWLSISDAAKDLIRGLLKANPQERMPLDLVLEHPWLQVRPQLDTQIGREVLSNLRTFSNSSPFFTFCVALVARQLDHRSLRDVHRIFCEMDTNGDGVLELKELKEGFERIFGPGSEQVQNVEEMFARLDLDGSGKIDYTEFCAAGIGERLTSEESLLLHAFKAFDSQDTENGQITKDEIKQVLLKADVQRLLTNEICDELSDELFSRFDGNGDGSLDFQEWLQLMRSISRKHYEDERQPEHHDRTQSDRMLEELAVAPPDERLEKAYHVLCEVNSSSRRGSKAGSMLPTLSTLSEGRPSGLLAIASPPASPARPRQPSGSLLPARQADGSCLSCLAVGSGGRCAVM